MLPKVQNIINYITLLIWKFFYLREGTTTHKYKRLYRSLFGYASRRD